MKYLPRFVKNFIRFILYMHHSFVVLWRIENGRWYVMRDRPMWFLVECIAMRDANDPHEELDQLAEMADAELRLRLRPLQDLIDKVLESVLNAHPRTEK